MLKTHSDIMFMLLACIFAGFASTMNTLIDNFDDFYFSLNDLYMTGIMTGWMFFFMGLFTFHTTKCILGLLVTIIFFIAIRWQLFISEKQYLRGMIPHHSMAIMMSKRLRDKPNNIKALTDQIIKSQEDEIRFMKTHL